MDNNSPSQDISIRDIVAILNRHARLLTLIPLSAAILSAGYAFLISKNVYGSSSTVNIGSTQVKAQLEDKIQVQAAPPLTFEGYKAIAYDQNILEKVLLSLGEKKLLPTDWQDKDKGLASLAATLKIRDVSPKSPTGTPSSLVLKHSSEGPSPIIAAETANLWTNETIKKVNQLPTERSRNALQSINEQITTSQARFTQAQDEWENFTKTSTLSGDRAELDGKTAERVQIDKDYADAVQSLGLARGKSASLGRSAAQQAVIIPNELSTDQAATANKSLAAAQSILKSQASKNKSALDNATAQLQAFQNGNRLDQWTSELGAYTAGFSEAKSRIIGIQKDLAQNRALLSQAEKQLAVYKSQTPGLDVNDLVAGMNVADAKNLVQKQLADADTKRKAAEAAYEDFQNRNQLDGWSAQLSGYTSRNAEITLRLSSLQTDRSTKEARLAELESQIAQEPKLLELDKDITSDPAISASINQGGNNLQSLLGLKLKNQESNPIYYDLLSKTLGLRVDLKSLTSEEAALKAEKDKIAPLITDLKKNIAQQQIAKARIDTDLAVSRENYNGIYSYQQKLSLTAAKSAGEGNLREASGDVLSFRNQIVDYNARIAGLQAEEKALSGQLALFQSRIGDLKKNIAKQERTLEDLSSEVLTKKSAYQTLSTRYDQIKNLNAPGLKFDNPNPEYQRISSAYSDAQVEEILAESKVNSLQSRIGQLDARLAALRQRVASGQVEAERVGRDVDLARSEYTALAQKANDLNIEIASSENGAAQVLAPAYPIYQKVGPKRVLIIALATILGFMAALVWAFIAEALSGETPILRRQARTD